MAILRMLIVGLIVGVLARFIYPGPVPMTWLWTIILGIAGSLLAGLVTAFASPRAGREPLHPAGFIASIIGAIVLIFICRHFFPTFGI